MSLLVSALVIIYGEKQGEGRQGDVGGEGRERREEIGRGRENRG